MSFPRTPRSLRLAGAALVLGSSLALAGCGFDAQTLQPYTPAQGVNVDVKTTGANVVKIRNAVIIANSSGAGRLSAAFSAAGGPDTLTSVAGVANDPHGNPAGELTVGAADLQLPMNQLVVLTGEGVPPIAVSGSALKPGQDATLMFTFGSGAKQQLVVPVVDANDPLYRTISPAPATARPSSARPSASPSK